jgi:hypothetical protein
MAPAYRPAGLKRGNATSNSTTNETTSTSSRDAFSRLLQQSVNTDPPLADRVGGAEVPQQFPDSNAKYAFSNTFDAF